MSSQAPPAFKDDYRDRFFIAFLYTDLLIIFSAYLKKFFFFFFWGGGGGGGGGGHMADTC